MVLNESVASRVAWTCFPKSKKTDWQSPWVNNAIRSHKRQNKKSFRLIDQGKQRQRTLVRLEIPARRRDQQPLVRYLHFSLSPLHISAAPGSDISIHRMPHFKCKFFLSESLNVDTGSTKLAYLWFIGLAFMLITVARHCCHLHRTNFWVHFQTHMVFMNWQTVILFPNLLH